MAILKRVVSCSLNIDTEDKNEKKSISGITFLPESEEDVEIIRTLAEKFLEGCQFTCITALPPDEKNKYIRYHFTIMKK